MTRVRAFVVDAELELSHGSTQRLGAAVTVALCGHWEHEGACRWPHNSAIDAEREPARFRTLVVSEEAQAADVEARIEAVLRNAQEWRLVSVRSRLVADEERTLAERLLTDPHAG